MTEIPIVKLDKYKLESLIRGIILKSLDELLVEFDIKIEIQRIVKDELKNNLKKQVKEQVYQYMEESEIVVPDRYGYGKKIALNTFVIQIIREVVEFRVKKALEGFVIKIEAKKEREEK